MYTPGTRFAKVSTRYAIRAPNAMSVVMPFFALLAALLVAPAVLGKSLLIDRMEISTGNRILGVGIISAEYSTASPETGLLMVTCNQGYYEAVEISSDMLSLLPRSGPRTKVSLHFDDHPATEMLWLRKGNSALLVAGKQWLDRFQNATMLTARMADLRTWTFDFRAAPGKIKKFRKRCTDWRKRREKADPDDDSSAPLVRLIGAHY